MTEILFRGKRVDNGDWIESGSIRQWTSGAVGLLIDKVGMFKVDPDTVGQYTGSTDKNGKKIFEGDIVEYPERLFSGEDIRKCGVVEFVECGFGVNQYFLQNWMYGTADIQREESIQLRDVVVVGNIYDNSELPEDGLWDEVC